MMGGVQGLALGSIGVGVAVLGLKYVAFLLTGSVALYSDALESIVNVLTAVAAFVAVRLSAKPADRNHPYGHHKAEYLAVILEGICIALAALSIMREAYGAFLAPRAIEAPVEGLLVNGFATACNAAWGYILVSQGKARRSLALVADGKHLFVDVATSIGVLIGVALVFVTGIPWLDAAVAALVAVNIVWSGWGLIKESLAGLMDQAVPDDRLERIREVLAAHADGIIQMHDLKTRAAGPATFIEFHLVVDGGMTVAASHAICDRLEQALRHAIDGAAVTVHVEPDFKAKGGSDVVMP